MPETKHTCPRCGFESPDPLECPRCGVVFSKLKGDAKPEFKLELPVSDPGPGGYDAPPGVRPRRGPDPHRAPDRRTALDPRRATSPATGAELQFGLDQKTINRWALPAAFVSVLLAKLLVLPGVLLGYMQTWLHEFGHAIIAWCGSRAATPIALGPGFAWTSTMPGKSTVVYLSFLFLIGVAGVRGFQIRSYLLMVSAAVLLLLQTYLTFLAPFSTWETMVLWNGVGGEFILGSLLVIGFYYKLPERLRWDFFRFLFLLVGMYALVSSFTLWVKIKSNPKLIPWGTGIHGRSDANGDMNRLHHLYGWSEARLTWSYISAGVVSCLAVVANYVYFLFARPQNEGPLVPTIDD